MPDEHLVNPETAHETSDVNVRALIWFAVIFVVFAAVTHIVIWWMFRGLVSHEKKIGAAPLTSIARPADADVPKNQPLLQPFPRKDPGGQFQAPNRSTPVADLVTMRAAEQKALTTYGWIDRQRGVVRIPINQAKQLLVQRGGAR